MPFAFFERAFLFSKIMGATSGKPHTYYNPNLKRPKKGDKQKDLLSQKKILDRRIEREGQTKWLKNAWALLVEKLKKAGLK